MNLMDEKRAAIECVAKVFAVTSKTKKEIRNEKVRADRKRKRALRTIDFIYFIQDTHSLLIKIGISKTPKRRIKFLELQYERLEPTGIVPAKFETLAIIKSDPCWEWILHDYFNDERVSKSREWFFPSARLVDFIQKAKEAQVICAPFALTNLYPASELFLSARKGELHNVRDYRL